MNFSAASFVIALYKCLTSGTCREGLSHWLRHHALITIALLGWFVSSAVYVALVLEYGPIVRDVKAGVYVKASSIKPEVVFVPETTVPTPPPVPKPEIPKVIPRPVPDSSSIKHYIKDRLKSLKDTP